MLEKYLKLIQQKKSQKDIIENFLRDIVGLSDFSFDVVGDKLKIEASSQDRFLLKIKEAELTDFLKENNLHLK